MGHVIAVHQLSSHRYQQPFQRSLCGAGDLLNGLKVDDFRGVEARGRSFLVGHGLARDVSQCVLNWGVYQVGRLVYGVFFQDDTKRVDGFFCLFTKGQPLLEPRLVGSSVRQFLVDVQLLLDTLLRLLRWDDDFFHRHLFQGVFSSKWRVDQLASRRGAVRWEAFFQKPLASRLVYAFHVHQDRVVGSSIRAYHEAIRVLRLAHRHAGGNARELVGKQASGRQSHVCHRYSFLYLPVNAQRYIQGRAVAPALLLCQRNVLKQREEGYCGADVQLLLGTYIRWEGCVTVVFTRFTYMDDREFRQLRVVGLHHGAGEWNRG